MTATVSNIHAREFKTQYGLSFEGEINGDLFAGGGGASTGFELGTGQPVHFAINHNPDAISQHQANHPGARHYLSDVFEVDPNQVIADFGGRRIGHLHASPDCTHHSQAAGGQPRKKAIRSLAWVVHKWAGRARPRIITMENVEQMMQWSPLVAKRCPKSGRVIKLDRTVAAPGERVPVQEQFLVPDKTRKGHNWQHFVSGLRAMGYAVQWRTLRACDYGAGTTRERLFLIARCDGQPITWPKPTHAQRPKAGQKKWITAADSIDWTIPVPSIFTRRRPLADNTLRRIAKGIDKFVLSTDEPFIVSHGVHHDNYSDSQAKSQGKEQETFRPLRDNGYASFRPLKSRGSSGVFESKSGKRARVSSAFVTEHANASRGATWSPYQPLRTITAWPRGGSFSLVTAYMAQMNGGFNETPGHDLRKPVTTITNRGSQQQLVTAFLSRQFGQSIGCDIMAPAPTTTAGGGGKTALVQCTLSKEQEAGALRVAAFLMHYYSEGGQWGDLRKPLGTITTKDRLALVTVTIQGQPYVIVDIGLRMLTPRELYNAQGFPKSYIIEHGHDGRRFSKSKQVLFVGNSVSPPPMAAICRELHRPAVQRVAVGGVQ